MRISRTPPGVRELKQGVDGSGRHPEPSRTPPGVRELKQEKLWHMTNDHNVAPLPGCVN